MVLPALIVGKELLILAGVGGAVGGCFLVHRHGDLQGFVDPNQKGVDVATTEKTATSQLR